MARERLLQHADAAAACGSSCMQDAVRSFALVLLRSLHTVPASCTCCCQLLASRLHPPKLLVYYDGFRRLLEERVPKTAQRHPETPVSAQRHVVFPAWYRSYGSF